MKLTVARFTLELLSPMHIGSGLASAATDAPVVRDAFGDFRIPGSSLAGALRAECSDCANAWGRAGSDGNTASMIEVSDGFLVDLDGELAFTKRLCGKPLVYRARAQIQDHVRIDHESGAAETGGKFDVEIIPQGTRFRCELVLAERAGTSGETISAARAAFAQALQLLHEGAIALGADVCSGLGLVKIVDGTLSLGAFDLGTRSGLEGARVRPADINESVGTADAAAHLIGSHAGTATNVRSSQGALSGTIKIRFATDGPLLVGGNQRPTAKSSSDKSKGADLVFGESLVADYKVKELVPRPWIPGSSLRGALRHRTQHVLEALNTPDSDAILGELFGSIDGDVGTASKVRIHGCMLADESRTVVQHVAIDRLTGGSLRGALYSEAPIWKDDLVIEVRLSLHGISDAQAAALAHAVIDMGTGHLPIGGGTRRGNGRLKFADDKDGYLGKAVRFTLARGTEHITERSSSQQIDAFIDAFERANAQLVGVTT